ncbi:helix-turn-helix domain-containing protein [Bosea sp. BH3]|uniref:helix-turn-helix domain-containing protein n=1 Tax=Bosea sp. BH3 TaxID=2871701 RepID=UPI0021CB66D6|nr:helix-turn-helix domain-containing protein [Bosea sp. BH3]MCU4181926.1 helix-turn-helix domain-containing protein [Bosea sp. BH3]
MKLLDIGEVAERSGVPPSTLRYYEEIGLIRSEGRRGLRRQFDPDVLLKLSLVGLGKIAGFSLDEIAGMFGKNDQPDIPRERLRAKANELQRQILGLRTLRDALRHVADCPAPTHLECPTFRSLLKTASRGPLVYRPSQSQRVAEIKPSRQRRRS